MNAAPAGNRVSRVILAYRLENIDAATRQFVDVLGIHDMEGPEDLTAAGLRVAISWNAGIEIIAPLPEGGHGAKIREFLDARGEGLFGIVYAVAELESAERQAAAHSHRSLGRLDPLSVKAAWGERFSSLTESVLPPLAGVELTLTRMVARDRT